MAYRRRPPCSRIPILLRLFRRSPLRLHIQFSPSHIASSRDYPLYFVATTILKTIVIQPGGVL